MVRSRGSGNSSILSIVTLFSKCRSLSAVVKPGCSIQTSWLAKCCSADFSAVETINQAHLSLPLAGPKQNSRKLPDIAPNFLTLFNKIADNAA